MHSFALVNVPTHQTGQSSQTSQTTHPYQSALGVWSANVTQQYATGNGGVQLSHSANFALQNEANPSRQMSNWQSSDNTYLVAQSKKASHFQDALFQIILRQQQQQQQQQQQKQQQQQQQHRLNKLQNENLSVSNTGISQPATMQNSHQNGVDHSQRSTAVTNATYGQQSMSVFCKQTVPCNGVPMNRTTNASHLQQSWTQQAFHPAANGGMTRSISSYPAAPSLPYDQTVNTNTTRAAAVHDGQAAVSSNQIHRPNFSQGGCSQNYTSSCGISTSQTFKDNNVATQGTSSNAQTTHAMLLHQINQQPSTQRNPLHNNYRSFRNINLWNERNFLSKTNGPPPYGSSDPSIVSRMSNQNNQTATVAPSENPSLKASQRVLIQRGEPQAIVVSHSNKDAGMTSPFKQNESCSSSMSGHTSIRAVAVVPPLSQEKPNSPASAEPCKSVDDAEKTCISSHVATICETTPESEESNQNQVIANKAASEPESLTHTPESDHHESVVERVSEESASQTGSGKQTEVATPQLPPTRELSLLPTKSWTFEDLTRLIMAMEAEPKQKGTSEVSNVVKIFITMWDKNIRAMLHGYKENLEMAFIAEKFCNAHVKRDTSILSQVSPDFKDQLKRYKVLKEGEVYSEPPYRSLWLNVNDQLDDIDKEFGFPWALKRHLYVDETTTDDFESFENVPEQAASESTNKVLPLTECEAVDMTEESATPQNLTASPQELSGKDSCDLSYLFKIEVLPPEEAKIIFEQGQKNENQSSNCGKETDASGSEQRGGSEDVDSTTNGPKLKKSTDNQLEEICCLARFIEMNSGLGELFSKCQCRDKQHVNEGTIEILKPEPDCSPIDQKVVNRQTATQICSGLSINLGQIIDLTDDNDGELFSFYDKESDAIFQTCSQSIAVSESNQEAGELSVDFSSPKEVHEFVFEERESELEQVQEKLPSAAPVQSSDSMCGTQQTKSDPSDFIETNELPLCFNQKDNCEPAPLTSGDESPSENKTQVGVATSQTSLNFVVNRIKTEKRQRSLDKYFPILKKPKRRLTVASDTDHNSEAQESASEGKTVELVLFGAGQPEMSSPPRKDDVPVSSQIRVSYEKHKPPEVVSVKLDSLAMDSTPADPTREYSIKQLIHEKWRSSIPTMSGSGFFRHKNKLKRQTSLPAVISSESTKEQAQTISPKLRFSDRTKKYIQSFRKKRRALADRLTREETKKRRYSVTLGRPEHQQGGETRDEMPVHDNIVLKFNVLPNTFNLADASAETEEAAGPVSDKMKPVEEKDAFHKKVAAKPKGAWYPSEPKQCKAQRASKNVSLFHEYQKKYKEKTCTSTDD